ncbi:BnaC07g27530D [Brassica napus]|uniref:BnaC07g27530D protein n=1 Tax=Brassica napus TaxID=3708 RepID=A0A078IF76_BRANA|nr:BnaC07g27530D [Brassica napus]
MGTASPPFSPGLLGGNRENREVCDEDQGEIKRSMGEVTKEIPKWIEAVQDKKSLRKYDVEVTSVEEVHSTVQRGRAFCTWNGDHNSGNYLRNFEEQWTCNREESSDINSGNEGREQRESSSEGQGQSFISLLK